MHRLLRIPDHWDAMSEADMPSAEPGRELLYHSLCQINQSTDKRQVARLYKHPKLCSPPNCHMYKEVMNIYGVTNTE